VGLGVFGSALALRALGSRLAGSRARRFRGRGLLGLLCAEELRDESSDHRSVVLSGVG
jgi:hypothetical protein